MKYCLKCNRSYPPAQTFCLNDGEPLSLKDLYGMAGRVINDKYEITALAAVGGMSAVYRAHQIGVHRPVAFKILLPNIAVNNANMPALFAREAQMAGRIAHENIATIHDAGQTEEQTAYIVMEWLEGHTLEAELRARRFLSYKRISFILQQIAAALDAAHEASMIHRDLKPSNIMITQRPDGSERVKVFDFGLAKVVSDSVDIQVSSALGTPHYASPEQFRTGEEIGPSADIYALGAMLYRMLSGRFAFEGANVHELIRAHLLETPAPLSLHRPGLPSEVENLVGRMLAKTPHYRPESASEIAEQFEAAVRDLPDYEVNGELIGSESGLHINNQSLFNTTGTAQRTGGRSRSGSHGNSKRASDSGDMAPPAPAMSLSDLSGTVDRTYPNTPSVTGSYNTLNNTLGNTMGMGNTLGLGNTLGMGNTLEIAPPPAIPAPREGKSKMFMLAAVAAVALVGAVAFWFFSKPSAKLTEKDTILLADITNATGEDVFDRTLKQALSVQLAQSPFLNLLGDDKVRETLRFMNRKADDKLTREVAREIAQRLGLKVAILGQINKLDQNYSLALEAVSAETGNSVAQTITEAQGKDQVLSALSKAATELREKLGESLSSIEKFNAPAANATTSSLEALRSYAQGRDQYGLKDNYTEAIALYKRALELDPNFALAWNGLAVIYSNLGQNGPAFEAAEKAYSLRDRVSEREKLGIVAYYYTHSGQIEKSIETYRQTLEIYPRQVTPHVNLSVALNRMGRLEEALAETRLAIEADPNNGTAYQNSADLLVRLGQYKESEELIGKAIGLKLDRVGYHTTLYQLAAIKGDAGMLQKQLDWVKGKPDEFRAYEWQAQTAAYEGKFKAYEELIARSVELSKQRNAPEITAALLMYDGVREAMAGQPARARKALDQAVTISPNSFAFYSYSKLSPFGPLMLALSGDLTRAEESANQVVKNQPSNTLSNSIWVPLTRAAIAVQKNDAQQAIELLRKVAPFERAAFFYPAWVRAQAHMQLKQGKEAAAEYEKILANRGYEPSSILYPLARLGLARAQALSGATAQSRQSYEEFFKLWKDADADVPVLVAAKKEAAALK